MAITIPGKLCPFNPSRPGQVAATGEHWAGNNRVVRPVGEDALVIARLMFQRGAKSLGIFPGSVIIRA